MERQGGLARLRVGRGCTLLVGIAALSLLAAGPNKAAISPDAKESPTEVSDEVLPAEEFGEAPVDSVASSRPVAILLALLVGLVGGGLTVWAAGRLTDRRRIRSADTTGPPAGRDEDRVIAALVQGLIASHDLATNDAQRARVTETLQDAGVTLVEPPPLTPFDPAMHHALGIEQDDNPDRAGKVARTVRPGWRRDGAVLRPPEVTVYPSARSEVR